MTDSPPRRIIVLGSTGSIGQSTLQVVEAIPGRFRVAGLAAGSDFRLLARQAARHQPEVVALADPAAARRVARLLPPGTRLLAGADAAEQLVLSTAADCVVSAIVGSAGLAPTLRAILLGREVALANKEPLVMAGRLIMETARSLGVAVLPVDSEHHALAAALARVPRQAVASLILTASGGPFLDTPRSQLRSVTVAHALRHPRWKMGPKITVDSATMMNKGLEVIEARWLFDYPEDRIEVVIHPESIVHGMVRLTDGGVLAYLSHPDMRLPIAAALTHPDLADQGLRPLEFGRQGSLTFREPDTRRFPALALARESLRAAGTAPAVLNAANETAVAAFLAGEVPFTAIAAVTAAVLERHRPGPDTDLEGILEAHRWAERAAREYITRRRRR
jgi:1-deoxy-D-xylulose-5-phosphate reductoisomerase